jgi:ribosome silencing factor RsfS/YbeB/iojap
MPAARTRAKPAPADAAPVKPAAKAPIAKPPLAKAPIAKARATKAAATKAVTAKPAAKTPEKPAAPRPRRTAKAREKVAPALLDRLVEAARKTLDDDKAENLIVLDVTGRADYADRLVIATALADRQMQAMASHLEDAFAEQGLKLRRDATQASPDWVLIDAGDLVVHLFKPEARALYALERMWGPDSPASQAFQASSEPDVLPDDGSVPEDGIADDDPDLEDEEFDNA